MGNKTTKRPRSLVGAQDGAPTGGPTALLGDSCDHHVVETLLVEQIRCARSLWAVLQTGTLVPPTVFNLTPIKASSTLLLIYLFQSSDISQACARRRPPVVQLTQD